MGKDKQKTIHSFTHDPLADVMDDEIVERDSAQSVQPESVDGDQTQAVVPSWLAATIAKITKPSGSTKPKTAKSARRRKKTAERDVAVPDPTNIPEIELPILDSSAASDVEIDALLQSLVQDSDAIPPELNVPPETLEPSAQVSPQVEPPIESNTVLETLIENIDASFEGSPNVAATTQSESATLSNAVGRTLQYIIFSIKGTEYGTALSNVIEIGRPPDVTMVPNLPDWVMGVTNLRGDIVSMVDLRAFLGLGQAGYVPTARVLMAQTRSAEVTIGMYVDGVVGVRTLMIDQIKPPTATIEDRIAPYLQGIYEHEGRMIVVLDFDKLLLSPEIRRFEIA
ncbi:MAG: chemotaxis protein CheW [Chloroflexi bacterium]|nr:chemotaxis protein CheW [Chloroflexota bacterium]